MQTPTRTNNRNTALLESAAKLFSSQGYSAATMRSIAVDCEMLPGSIYYHFPSKDQLLVAVYEEGVKRLTERVTEAIKASDQPWARLEDALTTHIEMIIEPSAFASVLIRILPDAAPKVADQLIALRSSYESLFVGLLDDLPLKPDSDRQMIRLLMIGAVNHVHWWFKSGQKSPLHIAQAMTALIKAHAL